MCRPPKDVIEAKPKLSPPTKILVFLVIVIISLRVRCDTICENLSVDAITELQNKSIVIFSKNNVWFYTMEPNQLDGPCPISSVFTGMKGPVDAALTIGHHEAITDFNGTGLYFEKKSFFTFKNLRQFQVEWGSIVYLPVKGLQQELGDLSAEALQYMKRTISYAYFDPNDAKSKLVFSDGTAITFTFTAFDPPEMSTIDEELSKYNIDYVPKTLTAGLTMVSDKFLTLYLFEGSQYCSVKLDPKVGGQQCRLKPIKEFFKCQSIKRRNGFCLTPSDVVTQAYEAKAEPEDETTSGPKDKDKKKLFAMDESDDKLKSRDSDQTKGLNANRSHGLDTSWRTGVWPLVLTFLSISLRY